jgi:unsaturated chondroitin disaccharide hydrolase
MAALPLALPSSRQAIPDGVLARVSRQCHFFGHRFPTVGEGTRYQLAGNDNWLAAFWSGMLWLAYAATGDPGLRDQAAAPLPSFAMRLRRAVHITHDLGFLYTLFAHYAEGGILWSTLHRWPPTRG